MIPKLKTIHNIAEQLNNYFGNIGLQMASNMRSPVNPNITFSRYLKHVDAHDFSFKSISTTYLIDLINSLKNSNSSGYDEVSTLLLKKIAPVIIEPLTIIINQSLHSGIFPSKLKIAKVVPIHKKGNAHLFENYRPISILSSISKVF